MKLLETCKDSNLGVFLAEFLRTPILKNIYKWLQNFFCSEAYLELLNFLW